MRQTRLPISQTRLPISIRGAYKLFINIRTAAETSPCRRAVNLFLDFQFYAEMRVKAKVTTVNSL